MALKVLPGVEFGLQPIFLSGSTTTGLTTGAALTEETWIRRKKDKPNDQIAIIAAMLIAFYNDE